MLKNIDSNNYISQPILILFKSRSNNCNATPTMVRDTMATVQRYSYNCCDFLICRKVYFMSQLKCVVILIVSWYFWVTNRHAKSFQRLLGTSNRGKISQKMKIPMERIKPILWMFCWSHTDIFFVCQLFDFVFKILRDGDF